MALGIGATARPTPPEGVPVLSASGAAHRRERHHGECANPDRRPALDPGGILVIVAGARPCLLGLSCAQASMVAAGSVAVCAACR